MTRLWEDSHLSILGGRCERWALSLLGGRAYITLADAGYRKECGAPSGWWLQCTHLLRNQKLEATTTDEAKFEASERLASRLMQVAADIRVRIYHMGVDDGTVPMCKAGGAPFGPSLKVYTLGMRDAWSDWTVVPSGGEFPPNAIPCPACVERYQLIHNKHPTKRLKHRKRR